MSWDFRFVVRKLPFWAPACPDRRGGLPGRDPRPTTAAFLPALLVAQEAEEDIVRAVRMSYESDMVVAGTHNEQMLGNQRSGSAVGGGKL